MQWGSKSLISSSIHLLLQNSLIYQDSLLHKFYQNIKLTPSMKNQTPTACLPSQQLAIIAYNQSILPQNIDNRPPKPDDATRINPSFRRQIFSSLMEEFQRHYTTEEVLTITFLQVMAMTSFSHLVLGFELLEKTGLSKSITPMAMSLFKYSLVIFTSFSIARVDLCCRLFKVPLRKKTRLLSMCLVLPLAHFLYPIAEKYRRIFYYMTDVSYTACTDYFSTGLGRHGWHVKFGLYWFIQTIVSPIGVGINMSSNFVIVIAIFTYTFWVAASSDLDLLTSSAPSLHCFLDKSVQKVLPVATARVQSTLKEKKKTVKLIKYATGLAGTLIFQNFFRLTTFGHVKAFMYLATSWLANLTLINACDDFGILNFILGNMILGSTLSISGLGIATWFTYFVCLFLYILGIKLKSLNTSQNIESVPSPRPPFLFWIFCCCVVYDSLFNLIHQI